MGGGYTNGMHLKLWWAQITWKGSCLDIQQNGRKRKGQLKYGKVISGPWWWFYWELLIILKPKSCSSNKQVLDMFVEMSSFWGHYIAPSVLAFTTCSNPVPRDTTHQRATSKLLQSIFEASIRLSATNSRFRSHVNHSRFKGPSVTGQATSLNHT